MLASRQIRTVTPRADASDSASITVLGSRLFERMGRGLSFKQPVDKFAQAVIIRPGELEGPSSVCRVLKVTRAQGTITASTECRDTVGYLSLDITIKIQSARQIIYSANGVDALNATYLKCPM